jgi:hypothetical protein
VEVDVSAGAEMIKESLGKTVSQVTEILAEMKFGIESGNYFEANPIWEVVVVTGHVASKH